MNAAVPRQAPEVEIPDDGLTIGEAAAVSGLTIDTLRYYEREGLTASPADRAPSGQRRYHARDLGWISGVVMLRGTGMPIRAIRAFTEICRTEGTEAARLAVLEQHRERVLDQLAETRGHLAAIERKIAYYRKGTTSR
ncbi:MerR family transcriptional regulator [Streptomyces liangshanensis]|uniref:MerR family transcriptional regulator n=1 Tax=Streptomyces liangshanensis TaxID=2717324 RepID=A0A6G9GSF1_9ACTN|nr:MerR family transcriptional regulator [Streptomyces liangshanensis]QIQ01124.1 MerR family transcriptional regulator [Streptomyces liangshanensis]